MNDSGPSDHHAVLLAELQETLEKITRTATNGFGELSMPLEVEAMEQQISCLTDELSAVLIGIILQRKIDSEESRNDIKRFIEILPFKTEHEGRRLVQVRTIRGQAIKISVQYLSHKRKVKKKRLKGLYPELMVLGIEDRCTPGFVSELSMLSAALGSYEEVQQLYSERGVKLCVNTIREIVYRFSRRARNIQKAFCFPVYSSAKGRRIFISSDGGRIRVRNNKKKRTKKGRRKYSTKWREPKLFIIYAVDKNGKKEKTFTPFIDGLISGPNAIFALLRFYLEKLNIHLASHVAFVADGAPWIWDRVHNLFKQLSIPDKVCFLAIDYYHAVENIGKIADLKKNWTRKEKKRWIRKCKKYLYKGEFDSMIQSFKSICKGRNAGAITSKINYFLKRRHLMDYAALRAQKLPIGSGGMESAIRQVVNLRLKGAGVFWLKEHAEAMLMLRAFFKAGQWNLLKLMANPPMPTQA